MLQRKALASSTAGGLVASRSEGVIAGLFSFVSQDMGCLFYELTSPSPHRKNPGGRIRERRKKTDQIHKEKVKKEQGAKVNLRK